MIGTCVHLRRNDKIGSALLSCKFFRLSALVLLFLGASFLPSPTVALDWDQVPERDIVLFYPGQLSWEMLLTESEHSGADKFREGKDCRQCHEGEERASGTLLVADKYSESTPIEGKPGFLELKVKTARETRACPLVM